MPSEECSPQPVGGALALVDGGPFALPADHPRTLGDALRATADRHPASGVSYLGADDATRQSYPELLADAACIVSGLRALGLAPGSLVLFQFERNEDFIPAFWACALGGFVPVPVPIAAGYEVANSGTAKLVGAWSLLDRPVTLAGAALAPRLAAFAQGQGLAGFQVAAIETLRAHPPATAFHPAAPDDTALLLLTSGSTGVPKAVRQTHRNLVSWAVSFCGSCGITARDSTLNWMPLDHVGGIVFFVVRDVVSGARQYHAATETVLRRPLLWLDWIDRHRITVTWAPNFVYGLVNEAAGEIAAGHWDLSCLHAVLNGGEAVVSRTVRRFMTLLAPHGLPPGAMLPVWGMSETSSGCIFSRRFRLDTTTDDDPFVAVGMPVPGLQVRITDEENRVLAEGAIGQMQIRGISVTPGYHRNPEATARSFSPDGWFVTGDLATIRDGQLAVVGREKDVIIINGVNFHSHEIEAIAEEVDGVAVSYAAACAVRAPGDSSDRLAVFFSPAAPAPAGADPLAGHVPAIARALRRAVAAQAGIVPDFVVPLAQPMIPKTSLGKIQRSLLKERFEAGMFTAELARTTEPGARPPLFERHWRPAPIAGDPATKLATNLATNLAEGTALPPGSQVLVLAHASPFADALAGRLRADGHRCVVARPGPAFAVHGAAELTIDPMGDFAALFRHLDAHGFATTHVVHAWAYPVGTPEDGDAPAGVAAQMACLGLLHLLRAWPAPPPHRSVQLLVVTSRLLSESVPCDVAKAPLLGLVHTIPHELDWLQAGLLDVTTPGDGDDVAHVLGEFAGLVPEARVEGGVRCVPLFRHVAPGTAAAGAAGFAVVSGGLGAIGAVLVRHLLDARGMRVLVLGRRAAAGADDRVLHRAGDVADPAFVRAAVRDAAERWQAPPALVFHLAGSYHEAGLVDETDAGLLAALSPKLAGAWALHGATLDYPGCRLVAFSSLLAQFGAMSTGAYAAGNAGLDAFARHLRALGRDARTVLWSSWTGLGMAASADAQGLRLRGFLPFSAAEGLALLEQAMACPAATILAGIDVRNRVMQQHLDPGSVEETGVDTATAHVAPRTALEERLARIWRDLLGVPRVGVTDNFFDLGGRSLHAARLFGRIGKEFGRQLPLATVYHAPTIEAIAALLAGPAASGDDGGAELHVVQGSGDRPPFFCIPGVGSDVIAFQDLSRELGPSQPFYGLQLRGLDGATVEGPAPAIVDVARSFIGLIRGVQPAGPYRIGGHCFGSLLAWEVARQLHADGEEVALLALIDPVVSNTFPAEVVQQAHLRYSLRKFRGLSLARKIGFVADKLRNLRRGRLIRQRLGSSIDQARRMHVGYQIAPYPGEIVVMMADDSFLSLAPEHDPRRHYAGFARHARYIPVPGNHESILHEPGVQPMARHLRACLDGTASVPEHVRTDM